MHFTQLTALHSVTPLAYPYVLANVGAPPPPSLPQAGQALARAARGGLLSGAGLQVRCV